MSGRIRSVGLADAPAIQRIYAPFVSDEVTSFETVPPDRAEIERRIEHRGERYPWLVFEEDAAVLGYAYASAHRVRQAYQWSADVSVYIAPPAHRRGIGRALYTALFDLLRRQRYVNIYAGITLPNAASEGLHKALGFVPVGVYCGVGFKFGQWRDVAWLHLRLREDPAPIGDPLDVDEVWRDPDVLTMFERCSAAVR